MTARGVVLLLSLELTPSALAEVPAANLDHLRRDQALRYMQPEPHLALARYWRDHGKPQLAFWIAETARRERFPGDEFDRAFAKAFPPAPPPPAEILRGLEPRDLVTLSAADEAKLLGRVSSTPDDLDALRRLADSYMSTDDFASAKVMLSRARALAPRNVGIVGDLVLAEVETGQLDQGVLGEHGEALARFADEFPGHAPLQGMAGSFYLHVQRDPRRALGFYLRAYFADPHFHDGEYAEQRVTELSYELAKRDFEARVSACATPACITALLRDGDTWLADQAVSYAARNWDAGHADALVEAMGSDDPALRAHAMATVHKHLDKALDDDRLRALLGDPDPRRRGLSAYLAVKRWGADQALLEPLLSDEAELVRYDAISALYLEGGDAGRALARRRGSKDASPAIREWISQAAAR